MKRAPFGLMVRACLVGLLVQVVVAIVVPHGDWSVLWTHGDGSAFWILFWILFVLYFPIIVAVNMGYQEGQAAMRVGSAREGVHDVVANAGPPQSPTER